MELETRTKFSVEEIQEYVLGFACADTREINDAVLHNAYLMLDDYQDGIEAYFERQDYYKAKNKDT